MEKIIAKQKRQRVIQKGIKETLEIEIDIKVKVNTEVRFKICYHSQNIKDIDEVNDPAIFNNIPWGGLGLVKVLLSENWTYFRFKL